MTFEIYCRDPDTSFYSSKNKFLCLDFSDGPPQIYEITYIQILSFSNGHEMKYLEGSVNLTFKIYWRGPVNSVHVFKIIVYFSEGPCQTYEILHLQYPNIVIFKRPYNRKCWGLGQFDIWNIYKCRDPEILHHSTVVKTNFYVSMFRFFWWSKRPWNEKC